MKSVRQKTVGLLQLIWVHVEAFTKVKLDYFRPLLKSSLIRITKAIISIRNVLYWFCVMAKDEELHMLMTNKETVKHHLNKVQQPIRCDHANLVHMATILRIYDKCNQCVTTCAYYNAGFSKCYVSNGKYNSYGCIWENYTHFVKATALMDVGRKYSQWEGIYKMGIFPRSGNIKWILNKIKIFECFMILY